MKGIVKRWYLLAVSLVLILSAVGLSATEVLAAAPPTPPLVSFQVLAGTTSYLNIEVGSTTVPGWCADLNNKITFGTPYTGTPYNYFAYYPSYFSSLPPKVTTVINWTAPPYSGVTRKPPRPRRPSPDAMATCRCDSSPTPFSW